MKCSMTGQEKGDLLIQATAQASLTVGYKLTHVITAMNIQIFSQRSSGDQKMKQFSVKNKLGLKYIYKPHINWKR